MKKLIMMATIALVAMAANAQTYSAFPKVDAFLDKGDFQGALAELQANVDKVNEKWEKAKIKKPEALPDNKKLAEVYNKMGEVYGRQLNPMLQMAAQQMPLDTVAFATTIDNMIEAYTKSVECDKAPDAKGNVKMKQQANNFKMLQGCGDYYNYAAFFLYQTGDTKSARRYFRKYIEFPKNPVFTPEQTDSIYAKGKANYDQAAVNLAMMAYQEKDWDDVLANFDVAKRNKESLRDLYIMKQQAYLEKGDSAAWLGALNEAINEVEDNNNFIEQLIYYYTKKNDAVSANKLADELLAKNSENKSAWYMKGCVLLNIEQNYSAARECFDKCLQLDPTDVDANLNMAFTYMNEVMTNRQNGKYQYAFRASYTSKEKAAYEKELADIQSYYRNAMPYVEKVREIIPEQPKRWAPALSMIYANLRMQAKADEVDAIISAMNK